MGVGGGYWGRRGVGHGEEKLVVEEMGCCVSQRLSFLQDLLGTALSAGEISISDVVFGRY